MIKPALPDRLSPSASAATLAEPAPKSAAPAKDTAQRAKFAALVDAASSADTALPPAPQVRVSALDDASAPLPEADAAEGEEAAALSIAPEPAGSALPACGQFVPVPPIAVSIADPGALDRQVLSGAAKAGGGAGAAPAVPATQEQGAPAPGLALAAGPEQLDHEVNGDAPADEPVGEAGSSLFADGAKGAALLRAAATDASPSSLQASGQTHSATASSPASAASGRAEMRAGVELDNLIAQVNEIREALRSARPQMTLQHAEFGLVSLRLEATGAVQDWRAVLASRDPGFAPAFQAALAERAMTASASTSSSSTGTGAGPGSGHGGSASQDQRYGFLPGSGQGSSLPYLAQSGQRDEGASQQHGKNHRRRDGTASAGPQEVGRSDEREQGLFA